MQAILMAGGVGSRLRPLTCEIPKPMAPILGKPVAQYALELLRRHGIEECTMTLQYLPDRIVRAFGDGRALGMRISYALEKEPLGTAGSVKNAMEGIEGTFLVMSGDALTDVDLSAAIRFHRERKAAATLVLQRVAEPVEYGIVVTDGDGRVVRFQEKPSWGEVFTDTANTGIYILEPEVMSLLEGDGPWDFAADLFPMLLERGERVFGFLAGGYWCDIGSEETYLRAQTDAMAGRVRLELSLERDRFGRYISPDARVSPTAHLERHCWIGAGAVVEDYASVGEGTVVGRGAVVSRGASLRRTVLGDNAFAGRNCQLRGCILCDGAQVRTLANCFDGTVVGVGAVVQEMATVKDGASIWPHKTVERHAVVREDVRRDRGPAGGLFSGDTVKGILGHDMDPAFLSRLASCFAGLSPGTSHVALAVMGDGVGMAASAMVSGLESAGALWVDAGRIPVSMLRYLVARLGLDGGIHLYLEGEEATVQLMGRGGAELSPGQERQMERMISRGNWPRALPGRMGRRVSGEGVGLFYRSDLLRSLEELPAPRRVGLFCEDPELAGQMADLLEPMGVAAVVFPFADHPERPVRSYECKKVILEQGLPLAMQLDVRGDRFVLMDREGERVSTSVLQHILGEDLPPHADPPATLLRVLCAMDRWEKQGRTWQDAAEGASARAEREIFCPNTRRGAVLRELAADGAERTDRGWVYRTDRGNASVLPDGHAPLFHIVGESAAAEAAEELAGWCLEKIRLLTEQ